LELRSSLSNPDQAFREWAAGGENANSGVSVNEQSALRVTAYLAAVKIISETLASLPLNVYRKLETGGKARATEHPAYEVLHNQANDEMTAYQFKETIQGHICNWGNGYAEIERNGAGRIVALWPLLPDRTWPERGRDNKIYYRTVVSKTNQQVILPFDKVLHIPGFGFDGLIGYNPVRLAREALGMALAAEEFGARFFGDGANVGGIVEYPGKLSDTAYERYKRQANEQAAGLKKSHRLWVLEEGLKYHRVGIPPEEAQFLETRKFQIAEIARMFRVPLHMLAELDRSTNNNIEHQSIEFVVHTIRPWLVRWEQQLRMKLFTTAEKRSGFFAEFLVDGLLRGDAKSRNEALQIQRQNGIINADEWREIENMNPQPGGQGQKYLVNSAMVAVDQIGLEGGEGSDANGEPEGNPLDTPAGE